MFRIFSKDIDLLIFDVWPVLKILGIALTAPSKIVTLTNKAAMIILHSSEITTIHTMVDMCVYV